MRYNQLMTEIRGLKRQVNDDFQFNALAFKDLSISFTRFASDVSERLTQIEGRTRLQEQRFDRMLEAVQEAIVEVKAEFNQDFSDLRLRVEKLENERPPA